jgi:hypothetical protein
MRTLRRRIKNPRILGRLNVLNLHTIHRNFQPRHTMRTSIKRLTRHTRRVSHNRRLIKPLPTTLVRTLKTIIRTEKGQPIKPPISKQIGNPKI